MAEAEAGIGGRPAPRRSAGLVAISAFAVVFGIVALVLAAWGWILDRRDSGLDPISHWFDITIRTVKVLLLSDIYYPGSGPEGAFRNGSDAFLQNARNFGVVASILFGVRLLLYALGSHLHAIWFRFRSWGHDVVIGNGPAAVEYAAGLAEMFPNRRGIHLAADRAPTVRRLATFARRGNLITQLGLAVAHRARRIVVDEGEDADTWQTAQLIARKCKSAEVLAHIADPWMRDRLSREESKFGLVAFSFAAGAARQVMLAHPPYLLADRLNGAARPALGETGPRPTQHILIVGFGQVGQAIAREFIVTSVVPRSALKITVVDPQATRIEPDFRSRHPDLCSPEGASSDRSDDSHVDFDFIDGDFRLNDPAFTAGIRDRDRSLPICAVYVAIDDDRRPLSLALAIRATAAQEQLFRSPIFLCAQHGAGLPAVRHGPGLVGEPIDTSRDAREQAEARLRLETRALSENMLSELRVVSFGFWREAFDGAGLLEPELDAQARAYHEEYERRAAEKAEKEGKPVPELTPWPMLIDQFRISNRRAAAHIRAKLYAAGYDLVGWLQAEKSGRRTHDLPPVEAAASLPDTFDDPRMKTLGPLEHRRWMLDRFLDGWRLGPRDNYSRRHPDLVPFDKLDAGKEDKDYAVILTTRALIERKPSKWKPGKKAAGRVRKR